MSEPGITVCVASSGRLTLSNLVRRVSAQLIPGDELLVDVNDDAPWGHRARNRMMPKAKSGNGLVFYDDDDMIEPNALETIRNAFRADPDTAHIFRMNYHGTLLWQEPVLRVGNVSTQMFCIPSWLAHPQIARWTDRYEGDFDFIRACQDCLDNLIEARKIKWHNEIVATYNGQRG